MKKVPALLIAAVMLAVTATAAYAEEQGLVMSNDTGKIEAVVKAAIAENPKAVEDFKNGKEKALMALFGRCMKELKGNCAPDTLKEILIAAINSL